MTNELLSRIQAAKEKAEHGQKQMAEGTLEAAMALAEVCKNRKMAQVDYWLIQHGFGYIPSRDRYRLLRMASQINRRGLNSVRTELGLN